VERKHNTHAKWYYDLTFPGMDMRMSEDAIDPRLLVDSVGTDGRFEGSARVFPGFGGESVHGVPAPSAATTIQSIANISFVKYVSIRKGVTPYALRGLVMFGDNPAADGKALYFAYRDSDTGLSDVVLLEDFKSWTDFSPTSFESFDIAYLGRYAYFVNSGDTTSTIPTFQNKEVPYNKAFFWDYTINDWDRFIGGLQGRFLGMFPQRALAAVYNGPATATQNQSKDPYDTTGAGLTSGMPSGEYTVGVQLISRKHNLRSPIRWVTFPLGSTGTTNLRATVGFVRLPVDGGGATNQLNGNSNSLTAPIHWGIGHVDGFRIWRSVRNDSGVSAVSDPYEVAQRLYLLAEYVEKDVYTTGSGGESWRLSLTNDTFGSAPYDQSIPIISDDGLLSQEQYDAVFHEVGAALRMKRLIGFDGILLGVTDPREPTTPDEQWTEAERLQESFCWSHITQDEPENFPVLNYEELDDASERVLELFAGASAAFATTNMGIYRIVRAGTSLSITRIAYPLGCVSRGGACIVGDTLYVVTHTGVKEIDGATGEVRNVRLLNRLVFDDNRWAGSLSSIQVGYDAFAGAVVFLNTSLNEMVLLWESTGAVTRIVDAPWMFMASGPDVETDNGAQRVYLVDALGKSHTIDAFRAAGKITMCGAGASDTVNGTITTDTVNTIIDSAATFPADVVGFKVYVMSGDLLDESATITVRDSGTALTISGLSGSLGVGDRYSIAPIVVNIRLHRLSGYGSDDPFVRKVASNMMASLARLGGETGGSDINAFLRLGLHAGSEGEELVANTVRISATTDQVVVRASRARNKLYPFIGSHGSNMDYEVDAVLVQGQLSRSEAESRRG